MGATCVIPGCKRQKLIGTSFHRLPVKGKFNRETWLQFIRDAYNDPSWEPGLSCFLCVHHFEEEYTYRKSGSGNPKLTRFAVPTLLFESDNDAPRSEFWEAPPTSIKCEFEEVEPTDIAVNYLVVTQLDQNGDAIENTWNEPVLETEPEPPPSPEPEVGLYNPEMDHQQLPNLRNEELKFLRLGDNKASIDLAMEKVIPHLKENLRESEREILRQTIVSLVPSFQRQFTTAEEVVTEFKPWLQELVRVPTCLLQNSTELQCANCLVVFKSVVSRSSVDGRNMSREAFRIVFEGLLRTNIMQPENLISSTTLPDLCRNCDTMVQVLHRTYRNFMNVTGNDSPVHKLLGTSVLWQNQTEYNIPPIPPTLRKRKTVHTQNSSRQRERNTNCTFEPDVSMTIGADTFRKSHSTASNADSRSDRFSSRASVNTMSLRGSSVFPSRRHDSYPRPPMAKSKRRRLELESRDFDPGSITNIDLESVSLELSEPEEEKEAFEKGELNIYSCPHCPRIYTWKKLFNEHLKYHASKSVIPASRRKTKVR